MKSSPSNLGAILKETLGLVLGLTLALASLPAPAAGRNSGGSGGGGGGTVTTSFEVRVTGYVTAIDYVSRTLTIGASYYGSGALKVDDNTKISFNNVNCSFGDLDLGDWVEARYEYATRTATKLSASGN